VHIAGRILPFGTAVFSLLFAVSSPPLSATKAS
jgi:hypothetical protein